MLALKKFLLLTTALTVVLPYGASAKEFNAAEAIDKFNGAESGGIQILNNADLTFNGGVIWDYAGYRTGGEGDFPSVSVGNTSISLTNNENITSNFEVEGGKFTGAIKMYKGLDVDTVEFLPKDAKEKQKADVISAGDFRISGGTFKFTENSELLMKKSATGSFSLTGGNYDVNSGINVTIGSGARSETGKYLQDLSVSGGEYHIDGTLNLQGKKIDFGSTGGKIITLTGEGTLSFDGAATISSQISWDTGILRLAGGTMDLKAAVSVNKFSFAAGALTIEQDSTLTVSSDFVMGKSSSLSGKGTLNLQNGANATFRKLSDFGSIIAHEGELTFEALSTVDNITIDKGTLNINAQVTVGNLVLENNAAANIKQQLIVSSLNFDGGTINFAENNAKLTLTANSTITNDAAFTLAENVYGTLEFTGGTLNFDDKAGVSKKFENDRLSLTAGKETIVNFNQENGVTLYALSAAQATLNFNKGSSSFGFAEIGHANESQKTVVNIADGVSVNVDVISAALGSEFNIAERGTLILNSGEVLGNTATASTFKGKGTLKVTGTLSTFNGKFDNFGTLQIDGSAAEVTLNYAGQTGDAVLDKLLFTGSSKTNLKLNAGVLTVKSLTFGAGTNGNINIAANGTLALDASGKADVTGIISGTGSIGGDGTLRLVDNTSVNFGGNSLINQLGTLEIGTGTATISGTIGINAVKFYQDGGVLDIDAGKELKLTEIETSGKNVVTGAGKLSLAKASTFGGQVKDLGTLEFEGKVDFNYGQTSTVGKIAGTADMAVNNGTLSVSNGLTLTGGNLAVGGTLNVANGLTVNNGTVSGGGFLNLVNGGTFAANGALRLTAGGSVSLTDTSVVKDLTALENAKINIANGKNLTVSGTLSTAAGSVLTGGELILEGMGMFAANAAQVGTLTVQNGAKATFAGNNSVTNLAMKETAVAVINSGATLTLAQDAVGSAQSVFTGAGTLALNKSGMTVKSKLSDLGTLAVNQSATLVNTAQVGTITAASGATLTVDAAAQANTVSIASGAGLLQNADMTVGTLSFGANNGSTLTVNKTLNITQGINAGANTVNGSGTINLSGGANGSFATGDSFANGHLIIGSGTASFTGDTKMASVVFSGNNGTLSVGQDKTLSLSTISTAASNTVTGAGTLSLSGTGSTFNAPIASLGEINIAGGSASFNKNATVGKLSFNGGSATIGSGAVLSISDLVQNGGTLGTVSGGGVLKIKGGKLSTGGNRIGAVYVGSGTVSIADNSVTGGLVFESGSGTLGIEAGKTLTVSDKLNVTGNLTGDGTLMLANGGDFQKSLSGFGTIATDTGALTFTKDISVKNVYVGNGTAYFASGANISDAMTISAGHVVFDGANTKIGKLAMSGAGKVTFNQNAEVSNGAKIGGTLDIGLRSLTVSGGLEFADNSVFKLRFSAAATNDTGELRGGGFGHIDADTVKIGKNAQLDMTVDYGLHTAENGTTFKLISGTLNSGEDFSFANSRYKLERVECASGGGLCYNLIQASNAQEVVVIEKGSQNNQNTAAAILDGGLFDKNDKLFAVAKHLDALSQKGSRAYLNALTAIAPDVSGALTTRSLQTQTQIAGMAFKRMRGLQKKMGNRSEKYRKMREMYGRSGGSPYESRVMRTKEYYKRAGYDDMPSTGRAYPTYQPARQTREYQSYDDDMPSTGRAYPTYQPTQQQREYRSFGYEDAKPASKVAKYRSQRQANYGAFYGVRPTVGMWAQALYNTNEYKSDSDEDGFSGDSTGVAMGLDATFADIFAVGFGYARTSSDLKTLQRTTDVTGDTFFLYGMYKPADWYLSGVLDYTKSSFDETKDLSGMTVADNYDVKTIGGQLMWGYDAAAWRPEFGVRYASVSRAAHEDSVGQNIQSFSNSVFSAVAEIRKEYTLAQSESGVWLGELSAGLTYDFSRSEDSATVSLPNGASYTVTGKDMDPYGAELGASLAYILGNRWDISARYGLEARPDWLSHTLTATLRFMF